MRKSKYSEEQIIGFLRQTGLRFSQKANDLLFGKTFLHIQSPVFGIGLQDQVLLKWREDVAPASAILADPSRLS